MDKANAKPILFNTDMVRAILDGRKTVTRRIIKPQLPENIEEKHNVDPIGYLMFKTTDRLLDGWNNRKAPYQVGDILYVRETWQEKTMLALGYFYKADEEINSLFEKILGNWRPSIHMPKEAARIFLKVTNVRVEKLLTPFCAEGSIAIKTLAAEGVDIPIECRDCIDNYGNPSCIDFEGECNMLDDSRSDFLNLWDSTVNKADIDRYGWRANPWVWVYEFERVNG